MDYCFGDVQVFQNVNIQNKSTDMNLTIYMYSVFLF